MAEEQVIQDAIQVYLNSSNRPYNANNLIDEFAKKFKKPKVIKALQALVQSDIDGHFQLGTWLLAHKHWNHSASIEFIFLLCMNVTANWSDGIRTGGFKTYPSQNFREDQNLSRRSKTVCRSKRSRTEKNWLRWSFIFEWLIDHNILMLLDAPDAAYKQKQKTKEDCWKKYKKKFRPSLQKIMN